MFIRLPFSFPQNRRKRSHSGDAKEPKSQKARVGSGTASKTERPDSAGPSSSDPSQPKLDGKIICFRFSMEVNQYQGPLSCRVMKNGDNEGRVCLLVPSNNEKSCICFLFIFHWCIFFLNKLPKTDKYVQKMPQLQSNPLSP